ncbi:MAG: hypothetical protein CME16_05435 [Gemmatimonadetes bacterium]|nr:hypothetical protein [Gemmatimonadota bacterium]
MGRFFLWERADGFQVDKKNLAVLMGNQAEADILGRGASPRVRPLLNISAGGKFFTVAFCRHVNFFMTTISTRRALTRFGCSPQGVDLHFLVFASCGRRIDVELSDFFRVRIPKIVAPDSYFHRDPGSFFRLNRGR